MCSELGAVVNFGSSDALLAIVASSDFKDFGFVSQAFGLTLIWGVALLALTAYLFRAAEFVYAAAWLFIAPMYIFASLYLAESNAGGVGVGCSALDLYGDRLFYRARSIEVGRRLSFGGCDIECACGRGSKPELCSDDRGAAWYHACVCVLRRVAAVELAHVGGACCVESRRAHRGSDRVCRESRNPAGVGNRVRVWELLSLQAGLR